MSKSTNADLPGADLLFGSHAKKTTEIKRAVVNEVVEQEPDEISYAGKIGKIKNIKVIENEPVKFTFYFLPQLLEDLEVAKFRLRMEKRIRVSKSDIVNAAVNYCMQDIVFLERLVRGEVK